MIILKGRVLHTTHSYTKHSYKKKLVEKEIQQKKAKYASMKQGKAKACTKLSVISRGGGRGYLTNFYTARLHPRSNPSPLYIPLFMKKVPLSYNFCWQMVPLLQT